VGVGGAGGGAERVPDASADAGGARTLVMDRVFLDANGMLWIVDYKTSRHEGTDVETFMDRERGRYTKQLTWYAKAIIGSRQGLYFPLLRDWRENVRETGDDESGDLG
jgi:hypothetical protein